MKKYDVPLMVIIVCAHVALSATHAEQPSSAEYFDETKAITLFAFDDVSIPFSQNLKLEMRRCPAIGSPIWWSMNQRKAAAITR